MFLMFMLLMHYVLVLYTPAIITMCLHVADTYTNFQYQLSNIYVIILIMSVSSIKTWHQIFIRWYQAFQHLTLVSQDSV